MLARRRQKDGSRSQDSQQDNGGSAPAGGDGVARAPEHGHSARLEYEAGMRTLPDARMLFE